MQTGAIAKRKVPDFRYFAKGGCVATRFLYADSEQRGRKLLTLNCFFLKAEFSLPIGLDSFVSCNSTGTSMTISLAGAFSHIELPSNKSMDL